ncbi:DUF4271 domain-containing protein [Flavobacteriaceae bacterium]|nr:DUF4271 domain-containing protein [Flavobacteriaceae bacterium]
MEALQRDILSNNWITIIFLLSLAVLFFLKLFEATKLKGYAASIFNKGFIEIEAEDNPSPFSFFHLGFSFFFFLMITITGYFFTNIYSQRTVFLMQDYLHVFNYVLLYMIVRFVSISLLILLFELKQRISLFLISTRGFLYSISIGLLFLNIIYFYSLQSKYLLITGVGLLFLVRFFMILMINKNLIIKELFYFILYLCAFELAPLFVLFRWIF